MQTTFVLVSAVVLAWGAVSHADFAKDACDAFCRDMAGLNDEQKDSHGRYLVGLALRLMEKGTGTRLPDEGRTADIPEHLIDPLIEAFMADYKGAGTPEARGLQAAVAHFAIAGGNVGHMGDHNHLLDTDVDPKTGIADDQKYFGINPRALRLATVAHDIGKGFLNEFIDVYMAARLKAGGKNSDTDLLNRYVMSHEFHSIARIPKIVEQVLAKQGIDTKSPEGRKLFHKVSLQILEMIRYHNSFLLSEAVKNAKGPDGKKLLDDKEIQKLQKAFWVSKYREFAGLLPDQEINPEYNTDTPLGAINARLNYRDRITLTTPSAWVKLFKQRFADDGCSVDIFTSSMITPATENQLSVKAAAIQSKQYLLAAYKDIDIFSLPSYKQAEQFNTKMIKFGEKLKEVNAEAALRAEELGLKPEELPIDNETRLNRISEASKRLDVKGLKNSIDPLHATADEIDQLKKLHEKAVASVPTYLYFKTEGGQWYRIQGNNTTKAATQIFTPGAKKGEGKWTTVKTGGHPAEALLELAVKDGQWDMKIQRYEEPGEKKDNK